MKPLHIDFQIPDILQHDIDGLVNCVNTGGTCADCWQEEINSDLKCCDDCLTEEQIELLRNYYYLRRSWDD